MHRIAAGFWIGALSLVAACAARSVDLKHTTGGSWEITCALPMDACVREIENTCKDKRYRILRGMSETRLRDAPPYSTEYRTSRIEFVCSDDGGQMISAPSSESVWNSATRVCSAGDTRACIGAGACAGGQSCRPDGTGFGPCDCAGSKPSGDAGPALMTTVEAGAAPVVAPAAPLREAGTTDAR
jgi:hypothetical protein